MHPRNIYKIRPNFADLAKKYDFFAPFLTLVKLNLSNYYNSSLIVIVLLQIMSNVLDSPTGCEWESKDKF